MTAEIKHSTNGLERETEEISQKAQKDKEKATEKR